MPESLGARLRRRREEQQIALSTVADRTKISVTLLEGLERDDVSRWPSGIFRRAFVRAYASAIGADVDATVREFLERHPDPDEAVAIPVNGVAVPVDHSGDAAVTGLTRLVGSAARGFGRFRLRRSETALPSIIGSSEPQSDSHGTLLEAIEAPVAGAQADARGPDIREWHPDLDAAARVCTDLGRVGDAAEFAALMGRCTSVLGAAGLVLWVWDPGTTKLWPVLGHGYAESLLAQIPALNPDDHNATAAAFRTSEPCTVTGTGAANGALAVPVLAPDGCVGVLAIEFALRREQHPAVRAIATIVAAQIASLIGERASSEVTRKLA